MSYVKGNTILASDLSAFMSSVSAVYGVGSGDKGYGQTAITLTPPVTGALITADAWTALRNAMVVCGNQQGSAFTALVPAPSLVTGQTIYAHEQAAPSSNAYELANNVSLLTTNRLTAATAAMTLTSSAGTISRGSAWGGTATPSITATIKIDFGSENAARYFFNSGGQVRVALSHPAGSTNQDADWNAVLASKVGTLTLGAHACTLTGSLSSLLTSKGYYELTAGGTTLFNGQNIGNTSAYSSNDVTIAAAVGNVAGSLGGNGSYVTFTAVLSDQHTGTYDSVTSGTTLTVAHYRATAYLTNISAPTVTTVTAF